MPGGACPGWYINREPFLDVISMHRASVNNINKANVPPRCSTLLNNAGTKLSRMARSMAIAIRQVTVLAPTGTIGFMMDCDTTGIEPDLALIKYKKLVGGGMIKIVNNTVPARSLNLDTRTSRPTRSSAYIDATGTIEGAPHVKDEHLAVFDCSFKPAERHALDSLHGPPQDDGRSAALHLGSDLEDREPAERGDGRRYFRSLYSGMEAWLESRGRLSRRMQAIAAALGRWLEDRELHERRCSQRSQPQR